VSTSITSRRRGGRSVRIRRPLRSEMYDCLSSPPLSFNFVLSTSTRSIATQLIRFDLHEKREVGRFRVFSESDSVDQRE